MQLRVIKSELWDIEIVRKYPSDTPFIICLINDNTICSFKHIPKYLCFLFIMTGGLDI